MKMFSRLYSTTNANTKHYTNRVLLSSLFVFFIFSKITAANQNSVCTAPNVYCTDITEQSIKFTWIANPNAEGYEVNINDSAWEEANFFDVGHVVDGLTPGEEISILVRPIACPEQVSFASCQAFDCPLIQSTITSEAILCNGSFTGALQINPTSGIAPFSYHYAGETNETGYFSDLGSGSHFFWVEDANGCTQFVSTYLFEPNPIEITTQFVENLSCNNPIAAAQVTAAGGTGALTYEWSNGEIGKSLSTENAGIYTVTVTDANGCVNTTQIEIQDENIPPSTLIGTELICAHTSDGTLTISTESSADNLTYNWNEAAGNTQTASVSNLSAGLYSVTITNAFGCITVLETEIGLYPQTDISLTSTLAKCGQDDGTITANLSGADISAVAWSHDATEQNTELFDLPAGDYAVTLTTTDGCERRATTEIISTPAVEMTYLSENLSCHAEAEGKIQVAITAGSSPFITTWSDETNQENTRENLPAGNYKLTITDAYDCNFVQEIVITEPSPILFTTDTKDLSCSDNNDGNITLVANGGTGDFLYSITGEDFSTEANFSALAAGDYTILVSDENDCFSEIEIIEITAPAPILIDIDLPAEILLGTEISPEVAVSGGTGDFSFSWSTEGLSAEDFSCMNCIEPTIMSSGSGNLSLTLTATDENDCTRTKEYLFSAISSANLFMPNIFSPNGDSNNDIFKPLGSVGGKVENYSVYNRKGDLVHEENGLYLSEIAGWSGNFRGETAAAGTYVYMISIVFENGERKKEAGEFTLVR